MSGEKCERRTAPASPDFIIESRAHDLETIFEIRAKGRGRIDFVNLMVDVHVQGFNASRPMRIKGDFGTAADCPASRRPRGQVAEPAGARGGEAVRQMNPCPTCREVKK